MGLGFIKTLLTLGITDVCSQVSPKDFLNYPGVGDRKCVSLKFQPVKYKSLSNCMAVLVFLDSEALSSPGAFLQSPFLTQQCTQKGLPWWST